MSSIELDFFALEKQSSANKSSFRKFLDRRRRFRGVSKIDTEVIKSVICKNDSSNVSPKIEQDVSPLLPVYNPTISSSATASNSSETAPLTIFHNGTVSVFDVTPEKAENIFRLAMTESESLKKNADKELLESFNEELPIFRRKSLQRFLEKRKESCHS